MSIPDARDNISGIADWVWTATPSMLLDFSVGMNQYAGGAINQVSKQFKPSAIGLPAYLDQRAGVDAIFPVMNVSGYSRLACRFQVLLASATAMCGWMLPTSAVNISYAPDLRRADITEPAGAEATLLVHTISTIFSRSAPMTASCRRAVWAIHGRPS